MRSRFSGAVVLLVFFMIVTVLPASAGFTPQTLEQSMSETLDLWREGRFEQLYEQLSHRGKISKEQFVDKMRDSSIRPACCYQKLENFKVLNERPRVATVYAKIGLEGTANVSESSTREFKLTYEENLWKMQLSDILQLSGVNVKKTRKMHHKKYNPYK